MNLDGPNEVNLKLEKKEVFYKKYSCSQVNNQLSFYRKYEQVHEKKLQGSCVLLRNYIVIGVFMCRQFCADISI